jgi:isoleucyl-tRNA synthetase
MHDRAPYKSVLTHGFTVDAHGKKMSKSLGNVVSPQKVMKNLGADIIRLWVAATDYRAEMTVSDEILKRTADAYRRIRNTGRFLLANLKDFDPAQHRVAPDDMVQLDRWAVDRALQLQQDIIKAYQDYNFHLIYQKVLNFCVADMGGFYLDIIKDRQYTCATDSVARRSCQTAVYHIAEAMVRWIAPILSFTADEMWGYLPGKRDRFVFTQQWYDGLFALDGFDGFDRDLWHTAVRVREAVGPRLENARKDGVIGSSLDAELDLYCNDTLLAALQKFGDELRFLLICSDVRLHPESVAQADRVSETELAGLQVFIAASAHAKCPRCWHHREDVGSDGSHPELCGRCVANVDGDGETRHFA